MDPLDPAPATAHPFVMAGQLRIGILGGSFDPVHLGHVHLAGAARQALALDRVLFIPCAISPHKLDQPPTPAQPRLEMLRLALRQLPWARIDERELKAPAPSYSWQTAESLKAENPDATLFWIMGSDQWQALPRWTEPQRLARCVEFIVLTRDKVPQAMEGYTLHPLQADHPASSSAIRRALAAGQNLSAWLDPQVESWIRQHGLYGTAS